MHKSTNLDEIFFLPGWGVVTRCVSRYHCNMIFFCGWRQNMCFYFVFFYMSMKKKIVITIWFGFVGDNTTWSNTMLGFVMDFEKGIKEKKIDFTFFLVINALILFNLFGVLAFCYFNFNSWKHLFCLNILAVIMFLYSSKDLYIWIFLVIFAFAYG
jgi:hypothetical protein